jgi:hypothetical protein
MMRGTFANIRIRNRLAPGTEGGFTRLLPEGTVMPIYDAAVEYARRSTPLIVIAGREYGTGSSRDWAAKGTMLLGVRAVLARSYERIHRSNLIGMGVLPLEFAEGEGAAALGLTVPQLIAQESGQPSSPTAHQGRFGSPGPGALQQIGMPPQQPLGTLGFGVQQPYGFPQVHMGAPYGGLLPGQPQVGQLPLGQQPWNYSPYMQPPSPQSAQDKLIDKLVKD